MLCTFDFLGDVTFFYNGRYSGVTLPQCCARDNTPAAWYWFYVQSQTTAGAKTRQALRARGAAEKYATHHCIIRSFRL